MTPHIPFPDTGSYPAREGNLLTPLIDGIAAFRRIGEAVEAARHSIWVTVAFITRDFTFPEGRGSLFDLLDRAVERGLDVRVLFWRTDLERWLPTTFAGSPPHREMLHARGSRFRIRWDRACVLCQHQKSWLIDAGQDSETAFVGGMNLNSRYLTKPGHADGRDHDAYLELRGPSATDIQHNFVQRWNEASERGAVDGSWGHDGSAADALAFPTRASPRRGASLVQIQRTMPEASYFDGAPAPGGVPIDIGRGERTILAQYHLAIGSARRSIYIENQALSVLEIVEALLAALARGVAVVMLMPAEPEDWFRAARMSPESRPLFDALAALGRYEHFALVGIAGRDGEGRRRPVHVHAKLMLVDDTWATIGSCNLHRWSLFLHSEINASFRDPEVVRTLRCTLLAEHLGSDTSHLDDIAALALYRRIAAANRTKHASGDSSWQGIAFTLDPATYGA
jgi:cardiolipin synthase